MVLGPVAGALVAGLLSGHALVIHLSLRRILIRGVGDGGLKGGNAAVAEGSVAGGEALDGVGEELLGAFEGEGLGPHDDAG